MCKATELSEEDDNEFSALRDTYKPTKWTNRCCGLCRCDVQLHFQGGVRQAGTDFVAIQYLCCSYSIESTQKYKSSFTVLSHS